MDITRAFLCDSADIAADGKLNVLGRFDEIAAPAFPALRPRACLVLQIGTESAGASRQHPVSVRLLNADGHLIGEVCGALDIAGVAPLHAIVPLPALTLPEPGDYSLEASLDGCEPRSIALHVTCAESAPETSAASDLPTPPDAGCTFRMSERWGVFDEIDPDSAYYWTREWQAGEREADEDIREGRVISFDDPEEGIQYLRDLVNAEKS